MSLDLCCVAPGERRRGLFNDGKVFMGGQAEAQSISNTPPSPILNPDCFCQFVWGQKLVKPCWRQRPPTHRHAVQTRRLLVYTTNTAGSTRGYTSAAPSNQMPHAGGSTGGPRDAETGSPARRTPNGSTVGLRLLHACSRTRAAAPGRTPCIYGSPSASAFIYLHRL